MKPRLLARAAFSPAGRHGIGAHASIGRSWRSSTVRSFHSTDPRSGPLDVLMGSIHTGLTTLHSTGLPWIAILPMTAVIARSFIWPLLVQSRTVGIKRILLQPLISARMVHTMEEVYKDRSLNPAAAFKLSKHRGKRISAEYSRKFGAQTWKLYLPTLCTLPVWLTVIETVRHMCGTSSGILGLFAKGFYAVKEKFLGWRSEEEIDPYVSSSDLSNPVATLDEATEIVSTDASKITEWAVSSVPLEESFSTGGALWFPNLLVPDPTLMLSVLLTSSLLTSLIYNMRAVPYSSRSIWQKRISRSLIVIALAATPLTANMPAAMLVYWIASSLTSFIQLVILDRWKPMPRPIKPLQPRRDAIDVDDSDDPK